MVNKLSICIPTYNRAKKLQECLEMILAQTNTCPKVEVVISDNASTDETQNIVDNFLKQYENIIKYYRNDRNVGMDMNTILCITRATGEYIALFSDDDVLIPGGLSRILKYINKYSPQILYSNYYSFSEQWNRKEMWHFPKEDKFFNDGSDLLLFCGLSHFSAVTFKKKDALAFIPEANEYIKNGYSHGCAFACISAHIALKTKGLFIFSGNYNLAARLPETIDYDPLVVCAVDWANHFHNLEEKGLLGKEKVTWKMNENIKYIIPRIILKERCVNKRDLKEVKKDLIECYKRYPLFYIYVYPLLVIPKCLLIVPYMIAREFVRFIRKNLEEKENNEYSST